MTNEVVYNALREKFNKLLNGAIAKVSHGMHKDADAMLSDARKILEEMQRC